jgi:hypothetical protein
VYVLADKYHKGIHSMTVGKAEKMEEEGNDQENKKFYYNYSNDETELFGKAIAWYKEHANDINLKKINFALLTSDEALINKKSALPFNVVSLVSFLKNENSNLLDFIGFEDITSEA